MSLPIGGATPIVDGGAMLAACHSFISWDIYYGYVAEDGSQRVYDKWVLRGQITTIVVLTVLLLLSVVVPARSSASHHTEPRVGFQPGSKTRSTMDIINSCLATMIVCIISAIHFDISHYDAKSRKLRSFWKKMKSKSYWSAIAFRMMLWGGGLLMPEAVVGWACMDYYEVAKDYDVMNKKFERWTLKHSYFARMGGFVITEYTDDKKKEKEKEKEPIRSGRQLLEQGAKLDDDICERLELEIADKSKADFLTKALAIVQITRFLLETIVRGISSLAVSPLEYFTSAHVLSALLMYIFWFHKPHGVVEKIIIQRESYAFFRYKTETKLGQKEWIRISAVSGYTAVLIGASTLASWNEEFPTARIRLIWRIFSIASVALPLISPLVAQAYRKMPPPSGYGIVLVAVFCIIHCAIRTVIIVLVFLAFRGLPSSVYTTENWLDFLPFFH